MNQILLTVKVQDQDTKTGLSFGVLVGSLWFRKKPFCLLDSTQQPLFPASIFDDDYKRQD